MAVGPSSHVFCFFPKRQAQRNCLTNAIQMEMWATGHLHLFQWSLCFILGGALAGQRGARGAGWAPL